MHRVLPSCWSFLLALTFAVAGAMPAVAQEQRILDPVKLERATRTDDDGLVQWAEWTPPKCVGCTGAGKVKCLTCARFPDEKACPDCKREDGKQLATCRVCAGSGELPDPLEKAMCPGCMGASFLLCTVCSGGGQLKVGEAKNFSDCPGCRGDGVFACTVCKEARLVGPLTLKPSLKQADVPTLQKAMETTDAMIAELTAFTPTGGNNARKELKALMKTLDGGKALHPAFKTAPKQAKDYLGKVFGGAQFQGHEENEAEALNLVKNNTLHFLKHQRRMMELALKRAEANAAAAGKED